MDASPDLSADVLLEHQAFVRSLARRLARDADEAEELEQDAWVAALGRAPREPERARAWLARVLRNVAWTRRRGALRRREHEELAAVHDTGDDPRALAERLELAQRVVAAVLELDGPYRDAVLLRHLGALDADAIAARLGVPRETARTRLRRAHERLRERLDREHGGRDAWAPLLLGWARASLPEASTTAATGAALTTGGALVGVKLAVAGVALVAVGAVWWSATRDGEARAHVETEEAEPLALAPAAAREERSVEPARVVPVEREAIAPPSAAAPPAPGWWLVGTLVGPKDDEPRARLELGSDVQAEPFASELVARGFSIALEELLAQQPAPRTLGVSVDHPDFLPAERWLELPAELALTPGERRELACDFELIAPAGIVEGVVGSIPGIVDGGFRSSREGDDRYFVALFRRGAHGVPGSDPVDSMACDENGGYRFRIASAGEYALVAVAPRYSGHLRPPSVEQLAPETELLSIHGDGSTIRADFDLQAGPLITGRIADPSGAPLAGEHVIARVIGGEARRLKTPAYVPLVWIEERFEQGEARTLSEEGGSFRLTGLGRVEHSVEPGAPRNTAGIDDPDLTSAWQGQQAATPAAVRVVAPAHGIELVQHGRPILIEVSCAGEPVSEPKIEIFSEDRSSKTGHTACSHGRFAFSSSAGMRFLLRVSKSGYVAREFELPPSEPLQDGVLCVELDRGPAPAHLTFVVQAVVAEPGLRLYMEFVPWRVGIEEQVRLGDLPRDSLSRFLDVADDGHIDVGAIDPGRWCVRVRPLESAEVESWFALRTELVFDLAPGEEAVRSLPLDAGGKLVVLVPEELGEDAHIGVRLCNAPEDSIHEFVRWMGGSRGTSTALWAGRNVSKYAIAPGDYELCLRRPRLKLEPIPFTIVRGEVTELRVELGD